MPTHDHDDGNASGLAAGATAAALPTTTAGNPSCDARCRVAHTSTTGRQRHAHRWTTHQTAQADPSVCSRHAEWATLGQ